MAAIAKMISGLVSKPDDFLSQDYCHLCSISFSLSCRRQFCCICANAVCENCSSNIFEISSPGNNKRVCDECFCYMDEDVYKILIASERNSSFPRIPSGSFPSQSSAPVGTDPSISISSLSEISFSKNYLVWITFEMALSNQLISFINNIRKNSGIISSFFFMIVKGRQPIGGSLYDEKKVSISFRFPIDTRDPSSFKLGFSLVESNEQDFKKIMKNNEWDSIDDTWKAERSIQSMVFRGMDPIKLIGRSCIDVKKIIYNNRVHNTTTSCILNIIGEKTLTDLRLAVSLYIENEKWGCNAFSHNLLYESMFNNAVLNPYFDSSCPEDDRISSRYSKFSSTSSRAFYNEHDLLFFCPLASPLFSSIFISRSNVPSRIEPDKLCIYCRKFYDSATWNNMFQSTICSYENSTENSNQNSRVANHCSRKGIEIENNVTTRLQKILQKDKYFDPSCIEVELVADLPGWSSVSLDLSTMSEMSAPSTTIDNNTYSSCSSCPSCNIPRNQVVPINEIVLISLSDIQLRVSGVNIFAGMLILTTSRLIFLGNYVETLHVGRNTNEESPSSVDSNSSGNLSSSEKNTAQNEQNDHDPFLAPRLGYSTVFSWAISEICMGSYRSREDNRFLQLQFTTNLDNISYSFAWQRLEKDDEGFDQRLDTQSLRSEFATWMNSMNLQGIQASKLRLLFCQIKNARMSQFFRWIRSEIISIKLNFSEDIFEKELQPLIEDSKSFCLSSEYERQLRNRYHANNQVSLTSLSKVFQISHINQSFGICKSYPPCLLFPSSCSNELLQKSALQRSQNRLPAITYLAPFSNDSCEGSGGGVLYRCSQPLKGFLGDIIDDEQYLLAIREETLKDIGSYFDTEGSRYSSFDSTMACSRRPRSGSEEWCYVSNELGSSLSECSNLRIVDARPLLSANGNAIMGKGYEDVNRLNRFVQKQNRNSNNCSVTIEFLGIENIHKMSKSYAHLRHAIMSTCLEIPSPGHGKRQSYSASVDDSINYYNAIHESRWLRYVSDVIRGSSQVALYLLQGDSVVVHCSDGWDRTSQLCALAQVLIDPYFRTIDGLKVLIEKDFIQFGHQFRTRNGMEASEYDHASPIFIQFLDCLWQMWRQHPQEFEYSDDLLVFIAVIHKTGYVEDFKYNCYKTSLAHRSVDDVYLWEMVDAHRQDFLNKSYAFRDSLQSKIRNVSSDLPDYLASVGRQAFSMACWTSSSIVQGQNVSALSPQSSEPMRFLQVSSNLSQLQLWLEVYSRDHLVTTPNMETLYPWKKQNELLSMIIDQRNSDIYRLQKEINGLKEALKAATESEASNS